MYLNILNLYAPTQTFGLFQNRLMTLSLITLSQNNFDSDPSTFGMPVYDDALRLTYSFTYLVPKRGVDFTSNADKLPHYYTSLLDSVIDSTVSLDNSGMDCYFKALLLDRTL